MINIISLTFSKFDVDRGISARASCRLAGPDGAALPLFAVSALPLSDPAVLVSATSQGGTEGDAGISWKERSPTNLGPAGGLALCSSWPQYRCPALGRDFILQKSVHTSPCRKPPLPSRSWPRLILSLSYHYTSSIFLLFYLQYYTGTLLKYPFVILNYNILGARTESHSSLCPHLYEGAWNQGGTWPAASELQALRGSCPHMPALLPCRLGLGMLFQSRDKARGG